MRIGVNASFLRKQATGIGQVTLCALQTLAGSEAAGAHEWILYLEADTELPWLPENFSKRIFLPFWKRDDIPRKILWERALARKAKRDGCQAFLSLSQSATVCGAGLRHVMIVHDIIPRLFPQYLATLPQRYHWRLIERGIRRADALVAVSQSTKNDIVTAFRIAEQNIRIAYPDVAARFRQPVSARDSASLFERYRLKPGYIYAGGGLEVRKNIDRLLHAYKTFLTRGGEGEELPTLVISGRIFPKSNRLATDVEGLVEAFGLEDRVHLLGFVPDEDLPALYRNALFFVHPSLYEGFGLPVLEALCQHTPVIVSRASSLPEIAGEAALYIDPTDERDIAAQMTLLASDDRLRSRLSFEGFERASRFGWESFINTLLESLLAGSGR